MPVDQHAGAAEHEHGKLLRGHGLLERAANGFGVVRVDGAHVLDADGAHDALEVELAREAALQRLAVEGVSLATRHGRGAVVQHADGSASLVVHGGDQRRQARVRERRVADDAHDGTVVGARPSQLEAMRHGNRRAHVDGGVHGGQRRQRAQRVAADVARDDGLEARELLEHQAVRAAGAERRRAAGQALGRRGMRGLREPEGGADKAGGELAVGRQRARERGYRDAERAHALGQVLGGLLHHVERLHAPGEGAQRLGGQRPGAAQLEHRRVRQRLRHVLVHGTCAHDAHGAPAPHDLVIGAGLDPFPQRLHARELVAAARLGEGGHHDPLRRVLLVGLERRLGARSGLHRRLRVRHAHRGADEDRHVEALGQLVGLAREAQRLG